MVNLKSYEKITRIEKFESPVPINRTHSAFRFLEIPGSSSAISEFMKTILAPESVFKSWRVAIKKLA